jgi:hypothetical protein
MFPSSVHGHDKVVPGFREIVELDGIVQHYAWGKLDKDSLVAALHFHQRHPEETSKEPYAEVRVKSDLV